MNKQIINYQSKYNFGSTAVFSYGNSKLPKSTLIVNNTSAKNCPSDKLKFCKISHVCYAKKCERIYKNYLNKNLKLEEQIKNWSDGELKAMLLLYIINAPEQIKTLRLNEAGDFIDQENINRWSRISLWLKKVFNITTYCYTCREDLSFKNVNFLVNASSENIIADRHFICLRKDVYENLPKKAIKCKSDCKICNICYNNKYKGVIYVKQH